MASSGTGAAAAATPMYPCMCPGHTKGVVEVSYSRPSPDGQYFITACLDKMPMLREAVTGDWMGTFQGHKGAVWSAKLNSNATLAATGAADFSAKIWDGENGSEKSHIAHPHIVKSVDFSHDDARLATGGQDKRLRVFDLARLDAGASTDLLHPKGLRKVLWTADGRGMYTGGEDGVIRLWDLATNTVVRECAAGAGGAAIMDMELSSDRQLITVAAGQHVLLIDAATLDMRRQFEYDYLVESASLLPGKGTYFVAGGSDVHVHVCNAETGKEVGVERGHHGIVHCVRFCSDGKTFTSGADDATVRIWDFNYEADCAPKATVVAHPVVG